MTKCWNSFTIIGNVGQAPHVGDTKSGEKYCRFSVATGRDYKSKDGTNKTETEWHNLIAWGKMAEFAGKYLQKGSRVAVKGRLHYNKYTKDGVEKTETQLVIEDFINMGEKDNAGGETVTLNGDSAVGFEDFGF